MRPIRALAIYAGVVFLGGAIVAPWLYWWAQAVSETFPALAQVPFHRFVHRALLGVAVLGLWPLMRSLGMRSARGLGMVRPRGQWGRLGLGVLIGLGSLVVVAAPALGAGSHKVNLDLGPIRLLTKLLSLVGTAIVVAVLEEILFRGMLFGALRQAWQWLAALALSSGIYAAAHFLHGAKLAGPVHGFSGFQVVAQMLGGMVAGLGAMPAFLNLALVGMILGLAYHRTGNLYLSMGLHAGWIFWLRSYRLVTDASPAASLWWWGTDKLVDGWLATVVLGTLLGLMARLLKVETRGSRYAGVCF